MPHALIVEDDPNSLSGLAAILQADGFSVDVAATLADAREALTRFIPDVVLIDLNLPDGKGLDLLQHLRSQPPDGTVPVIVMTGNATVESAIEGLRHGIWDYLLKPVSIPRLRSLLARIPRPYELSEEVQSLRSMLRELGRFGPMIGRSEPMQAVYDTIERIAQTEAAVFVHGEPGSGKQTVAHTIHEMSRRRKGPFVRFDCAATRDGARSFDSLLFGHERGAFAGADIRMAGVLEEAAGGTLYVENVTSLPRDQQLALLGALDGRTIRRMGGSHDTPADFRLIVGAEISPTQALATGALVDELVRRLSATTIGLPPLRERGADIELLALHCIDECNAETGQQKRLAPGVLRELHGYDWPGNVRELRTTLRHAYRTSDDTIETLRSADGSHAAAFSSVQVTVGTPLATVEELLIRATLDAVGGTRHRAASMLGISPKTLYNKLQRMKMN
ncbi:sigma-54-dependent transcriptional regulator [Pararobbsia silviterrae]|uniref:Sigma-54-dependent Fis family transcriptional regulator n=1 Tax=Pararobbsia silviterrae TaxID=1792498 RepID=A0A494Y4L3_9BURK|nr:sigma-54 dependent transcriptional regulator [Pararobbsia silviterrae]RKP56443.1 sigma-54-dependent Fis family transcriptional regulator [Pararobbsia silviterrae]